VSANDHAHIELLQLIVEYYKDPEAWVDRWSNTASRHALIERVSGTPAVAAALATEDFEALLQIGVETAERTTIDVVHGPGFSDQYAGNNVYLAAAEAEWTDAADDSGWVAAERGVLKNQAGRRFRFRFTVYAPDAFQFSTDDTTLDNGRSFELQLAARRYAPSIGADKALTEISNEDGAHRWGAVDRNGLGSGVARAFGHPAQDVTGVTVRIGFETIVQATDRGTCWTLTTPALEIQNADGAPLVDVMLNADFQALNYVSPAGAKYEGMGPMAHKDSILAAFTLLSA
jgi:hypothetical protein